MPHGAGAKSYDGEKAWSSINPLILSGLVHGRLNQWQQQQRRAASFTYFYSIDTELRKEAARARRSTYSVTQQAFMEGQQNQVIFLSA
jgi:hypothetical protein